MPEVIDWDELLFGNYTSVAEMLEDLYVFQKLGAKKIGDILGVDQKTVLEKLRKMGYKIKVRGGQPKEGRQKPGMIPPYLRDAFLKLSDEDRLKLINKAVENIKRPNSIKTKTVVAKTGCGNIYITVSIDPRYPYEVKCILGKVGGCVAAFLEPLSLIMTEALKAGVHVSEIAKHLSNIKCPNSSVALKSCPEAIADILNQGLEAEGGGDAR